MMAYHVNPETGRPNICRANVRACPYGGVEVHFEDQAAARAYYEQTMEGELVTAVTRRDIQLPANTAYRLSPQSGTYFVDYEYDSYDCADPYSCSESNDYCRDREYGGLRIEEVSEAQVYEFAKSSIGSRDLPESLKAELDENMEEWRSPDAWDISSEPDYYGDTVTIEAPRGLDQAISTWFYSQAGAVDAEGVLPYLRGLGVDTAGKDPVTAVKHYIADRNGGKLSSDVAAARVVEMKQVGLKSVAIPSAKKYAGTAPVAPTPVAETGVKNEVCGIVLETEPGAKAWRGPTKLGQVKLLDGYGRFKHYQDNTSRTKGTFIVLRKQL